MKKLTTIASTLALSLGMAACVQATELTVW